MDELERPSAKRYLGDGVYGRFDGYHIVLTTSDGIAETEPIFIDGRTFKALVDWQAQIAQAIAERRAK